MINTDKALARAGRLHLTGPGRLRRTQVFTLARELKLVRASLAILLRTSVVMVLVAEIHRPARSLFYAEYGKIRPARRLPLLPSADVTTDAPAAAADLHGPDLPPRHATAESISAWSPAEVFAALESSPQGLAAARAASRLAAFGPNELRAAKRPPVIRKVLAQLTNLFALVLLGASVITFVRHRRPQPPVNEEPARHVRSPGPARSAGSRS